MEMRDLMQLGAVSLTDPRYSIQIQPEYSKDQRQLQGPGAAERTAGLAQIIKDLDAHVGCTGAAVAAAVTGRPCRAYIAPTPARQPASGLTDVMSPDQDVPGCSS